MAAQDETWALTTWNEAKILVETNHIDRFRRIPGERERYRRFRDELVEGYGSVLEYMKIERLRWTSTSPSGHAAFTNAADYRILHNDWPYALDAEVKHVVVWTKFKLEEEEWSAGILTAKAKGEVEGFVVRTFCESATSSLGGEVDRMRREDLVWFKNWTGLRSIHALEHFHVLLRNPPAALLERVTDSDRPLVG